ncbi:MAG: hypothetical protein QNJ68_20835 [Microcoleaceae cyanobacterium MO_207.B10]|nr:hypothetical protein [Microcoleaceae cyanobacterium MO_207.B10]
MPIRSPYPRESRCGHVQDMPLNVRTCDVLYRFYEAVIPQPY